MIQIKKTILTLVALLAVTTGAWADETPLLTIESKDYVSFKSGSVTFDDKVTVTFSNSVDNNNTNGWYTYGESLLTVAGTNGYTITSCKFYTKNGPAATGYTIEGESPSVYLSGGYVFTDNSETVTIGYQGVKKIEVYGAAASSATLVDLTRGTGDKINEWTLTNGMPAGNVTLEPEYYPQATLTAAPTPAEGAKATTDDLLVSGGTVATITGSDPAAPQGTLMYYVSTSTMTTEALLALDADMWVAEPTAAGITQKCGAFVYYYVKGNESTDDALNFSDGDISSDNVLNVPIFPAPTYAVTFADDLAEPTLWTASPNADVTKGQTVTVTYTGTKKIIGVKAEKKAAAPAAKAATEATAEDKGKLIGTDGNIYADVAAATAAGTSAVAKIIYIGTTGHATYSHGLALALTDEGKMAWGAAMTACTGKNTSTPVTNATWLLASKDQWDYMLGTNGAGGFSALRDGFTSVGGSNLQSGEYWSSTEVDYNGNDLVDSDYARFYIFNYGGIWSYDGKGSGYRVRACLAF